MVSLSTSDPAAVAGRAAFRGFSAFAMAGIMRQANLTIMELAMDKLEAIVRRAEARRFTDEDYETAKTVLQSYVHLVALLKDEKTKMHRLRKMLFGASTEKLEHLLGGEAQASASTEAGDNPESDDSSESAEESEPEEDAEPPPRKGHGRNGADAYHGGEERFVPHESLQPGDPCPECGKGTVYETPKPGVLIRLVGSAPVQAKVYRLQKLRCHLCGKVFTAQVPAGAGREKYDATAGSMIGLLKYGMGMPFNRFEGLQGSVGIPLPASTQWDIVHAQAQRARPVYDELIRQAAAGDVLHNDDTTVKILEWMGKRAKQAAFAEDRENDSDKKKPSRSGLFTSGVVSTREGRRIALFFSGRRHAGENLADVLARRAEDLAAPIQMCDALSRNLPGELKTIVANCLAHGRRRFVEVMEHFPEPCRHVLESLSAVYHNDALARQRNLSPEARLAFHQTESGPILEKLHSWLSRQFEDRRVEPNSSLGGAIAYMLKHWEKLTLFLRVSGAPLDNNICERALKKAIRHRRNSLFYKTPRGAGVGDLFMSLIHTCELCGANPFDYLTELERHADELSSNPQNWMPWNYRQTPAPPAA
jgi:transposase